MNWKALSAALGLLAVAAGAFGAHALKSSLPMKAMETFETGAKYHMYHAIILYAAAVANVGKGAMWSFLIGVFLFSGCCYLYAFTGVKAFAMIVPIGGASLLLGWGLLLKDALKNSRPIV